MRSASSIADEIMYWHNSRVGDRGTVVELLINWEREIRLALAIPSPETGTAAVPGASRSLAEHMDFGGPGPDVTGPAPDPVRCNLLVLGCRYTHTCDPSQATHSPGARVTLGPAPDPVKPPATHGKTMTFAVGGTMCLDCQKPITDPGCISVARTPVAGTAPKGEK